MKTLICLFFLISSTAFAGDPQPKYLKDGTIVVQLKDGTKHRFSANDYKVVPRVQRPAKQVQPVETLPCPAQQVVVQVTNTVEAPAAPDNEVSVYGGYGMTGLNASVQGTTGVVSQKGGAVFGLGYSRRIDGPVTGKVVIFDNNAYFGGLGLEF